MTSGESGGAVYNRDLWLAILMKYGRQWRFADAIGVTDSYISQVIVGRKPLSDAEKKRWAELLGKPVKELWRE